MSTADSKSHLVVDLGDWTPPGRAESAPGGASLASSMADESASSPPAKSAAGITPAAKPSSGRPIAGKLSRHQSGPIYLDGEVLACACPECGSPMSIRLWLMLADCWHCGTSVELTEEQEREAQRLLAEKQQSPPANPAAGPWARPVARPAAVVPPPIPMAPPPPAKAPPVPPPAVPSVAPPAAAVPRKAAPPAPPQPAQAQPKTAPPAAKTLPPPQASPAAKTFAQAPTVAPRRTPAAVAAQRMRRQLAEQQQHGFVRVWASHIFRSLPSWLASMILHMVLLILLAIWMNPQRDDDRFMILATQIGPEDTPGDIDDIARSDDPESFQDPGDLTPHDVEASEALKQEGTIETDIFNPLPMLSETPDAPQFDTLFASVPISTSEGQGSIYLGRDPKARANLVQSSGGTIASEAAVARGLEWLTWHQNTDGSWSLDQFHKAGKCNGRCSHAGQQCDTAGTALALLPFLGAGQTHKQGKYTNEVRQGLEWLVKHQKGDGNLWSGGMQLSQMYSHGQAAIALSEAYALTQDSYLRVPAQKSLDFIVAAQHEAGGWRYYPNTEGDTSVLGWQLMALRSGHLAGLEVPPEAFERATKFLNSVQDDTTGARYSYQPGHGASPTMTAEALLCRQYAGWPRNHPGLTSGVRDLIDKHAPRAGPSNMYYWYYATQVMHHMGGQAWKDWNPAMRDLLINTQESKGHQAGSWQPTGNFDPSGGRLYMTALAVCTLEVYYRHLPLYQETALELEK